MIRTEDKSRFCLLLGESCYLECPHHYYRDFNGCCKPPEEKGKIYKENGKQAYLAESGASPLPVGEPVTNTVSIADRKLLKFLFELHAEMQARELMK